MASLEDLMEELRLGLDRELERGPYTTFLTVTSPQARSEALAEVPGLRPRESSPESVPGESAGERLSELHKVKWLLGLGDLGKDFVEAPANQRNIVLVAHDAHVMQQALEEIGITSKDLFPHYITSFDTAIMADDVNERDGTMMPQELIYMKYVKKKRPRDPNNSGNDARTCVLSFVGLLVESLAYYGWKDDDLQDVLFIALDVERTNSEQDGAQPGKMFEWGVSVVDSRKLEGSPPSEWVMLARTKKHVVKSYHLRYREHKHWQNEDIDGPGSGGRPLMFHYGTSEVLPASSIKDRLLQILRHVVVPPPPRPIGPAFPPSDPLPGPIGLVYYDDRYDGTSSEEESDTVKDEFPPAVRPLRRRINPTWEDHMRAARIATHECTHICKMQPIHNVSKDQHCLFIEKTLCATASKGKAAPKMLLECVGCKRLMCRDCHRKNFPKHSNRHGPAEKQKRINNLNARKSKE